MKIYFKNINIIIIIIFIAIIISGCQTYDDMSNSDSKSPIISPHPLENNFDAILYYSDKYNEKLVMKNKKIKDITKNIELEILEELIGGLNGKNINNLIPKETKIRSIDIENQIAYINLSSDIIKENLSPSEEVLLTYSIVNTITELDSIKSVQLLIDGEKKEFLSNVMNIEKPLQYSELLVEDKFINPFDAIKDYYDMLNNRESSKLASLFKNTDKKSRVYYEIQYIDKNIKKYNIKSYKLNNYKKALLVDVEVEAITNDDKKVKYNKLFSMEYSDTQLEKTFKINEIY